MLKYFALVVPFMSLILRLILPLLINGLKSSMGFDLEPYYMLIVSLYIVMLLPMLFGILIGFMLLDERDEMTLLAMQVSPLSIERYMLYRITTPMLLSYPFLLISIPIIGVGGLDWSAIFWAALVASFFAPIMGLLLPLFANNKIEGFAIMKSIGGVFIAPIVAYFIKGPWQYVFGIFPTYWSVKVLWLSQDGISYWLQTILGIVISILYITILLRKLRKKVFD